MLGDPSGGSDPPAGTPRIVTRDDGQRFHASPESHLALVQPTPLVDRIEETEMTSRRLTVADMRLLTLTSAACAPFAARSKRIEYADTIRPRPRAPRAR
jgi:hypothetical protein